jgi:hypothetical protein
MMKRLVAVAILILATVSASHAQSVDTKAAETQAKIIAMERAALNRSDKGDFDGGLEISDPDVVYIDPSIAQPIVGLEALRRYYHAAMPSDETGSGVMSNVKVQLAGKDTAVLSFNYVTESSRTHHVTKWNATEVYHRTGNDWRILHTHWSFMQPELAKK